MLQLTPQVLERHLEGLVERLRGGVAGRVREAIEQSVAQIVVAADGTMTLVAKPYGLLRMAGSMAHFRSCGSGPIMGQTDTVLTLNTLK